MEVRPLDEQVVGPLEAFFARVPESDHNSFAEDVQAPGLVQDRVLLDGRRLSLRDVRWPVLNVVAAKDHIVPSASATPVCELVGSEQAETLELPAGHVGLVMGKAAATTTLPKIFDWLHEHGTTEQEGD